MLAAGIKRQPDSNSFAIFQDLNHEPRRIDTTPDKRPKSSSAATEFKVPTTPQTAKENPKVKQVLIPRRNSLPTLNNEKQAFPRVPRLDTRPRNEVKETPKRTAPLSLWDYLQVELAATDSDEAQEYKRERVKNFLILPNALERTLLFGFVVCLDSFLYIFTILPIRLLRSLINLTMRLARARASLKSSEKVDILKSGLILLTCIILNQLDASRIYHNIRGQAAIKLYVLYNVLEIGDKLFCALGQDVLDCLFSKDYVKSAVNSRDSYVDQSPAISKRIGLPVIPLVCLTIRASSQIVSMFISHDTDAETLQSWDSRAMRALSWSCIAVSLFALLVIGKLCLGVSIIRFAHARYTSMQAREQAEQQLEQERQRARRV
ncbi:hypothetical protein MRB53_040836 [Persea americana]|nr:hypothetical protein MRB53_040836 [Persea americana]